jgi:hypothetical protein
MSRILIPTTTLVGQKLLSISQQIVGLSNDVNRLKSITDAIGTANLELANGEAQIPTGQGATVAAGIAQIKTAVDGLASLVATIDRG